MSLYKKYKLLHPNIHTAGFDSGSGNEEYSGGCINLFGVQIDFDWDTTNGCWKLSCPYELKTEDIKKSLDLLFYHLNKKVVYEVFSDESKLTLINFVDANQKNKVFYDDNGRSFIFARKYFETYICLEVKAENGSKAEGKKSYSLTDNVALFRADDLVYNYPDDYIDL